jgi:basic amino acid/polyamine antiporter, APA family
MTAVNYIGVEKTARVTRLIVAVVLGVLAVLVTASLTSPEADFTRLVGTTSLRGVLESAGLLFFAFAGYARVATLGEEVVDPERVIPKAIPLALFMTLGVYVLVAVAALAAIGSDGVASAEAPLAAAAAAAGSWVVPLVRVGGTVAAVGVLLSLLAGVSRTSFAMARDRHLPSALAAVHHRFGTPYRAELAVAVAVIALVLVADLRGAIGFSSFAILTYYAIANASAYRQPAAERRWPRWLQVVGVAGCALLAFSLPVASVVGGLTVLGLGAVAWAVRRSANGGAADG